MKSGSAVNTWLRSRYSDTQYRYVNTNGNANNNNATNGNNWALPALLQPRTSRPDRTQKRSNGEAIRHF